MNEKKASTISSETVRMIVGAAICDLAAYAGSIRDPFIVGGQYTDAAFRDVIKLWCFDRKLSMDRPDKADEFWSDLCTRGLLVGTEKFDGLPRPVKKSLPPPEPSPKPAPEPAPEPPRKPPSGHQYREYKDGDQNDTPAGGFDSGDNADDWKDEEDRKKNWRDEGEDWKNDQS